MNGTEGSGIVGIVALSELGKKQAKELGQRYNLKDFDAVFTSDMERAYKTANIAFDIEPDKLHIDWRLRECDYGDLTQHAKEEVDDLKVNRVSSPFPNGESYEQTSARMKSFLEDLTKFYDGKKVMIIGHRATQYGLQHWIKNISLEEAIAAPWKWQPGWVYELAEQLV